MCGRSFGGKPPCRLAYHVDILPAIVAIASALSDVAQAVALLAAGIWTYRRFVRTREDESMVDADVTLDVLGSHGGALLGVVTAAITNSGKVRHKIAHMHFDLRVINSWHPLEKDTHRMGYVNFPDKLYSEQQLFPPEWVWSFVEPGATNKYRYSVILPPDVKFALVKLKVVLPGEDQFFSSWRVFTLGTKEAPG